MNSSAFSIHIVTITHVTKLSVTRISKSKSRSCLQLTNIHSMAKGSQLSQLKAALSHAGVTGPPNSKKRKRAVSTEKDKEKKAAKLDEIQKRLNPFDVKVTKLKHDVGGRRLKGITGRPAQSKQAGLEQVCYLVNPHVKLVI